MISQEQFEKLSTMMSDKGVGHEAFEILAGIRRSETRERLLAAENQGLRDVLKECVHIIDFETIPCDAMYAGRHVDTVMKARRLFAGKGRDTDNG